VRRKRPIPRSACFGACDGSRKFILVQLPEPCDQESATFKADYKTIADICKERVRRVIEKLNDKDAGKLDLDGGADVERGFRVFRLAESNFQPWDTNVPQGEVAALEKQLEMHVDHVRDGRTDDNLLYELLLKSGYPLATTVEKVNVAGKTVYSVADGLLLVCLEKVLTHELIKAMADRKPERVVCLDECFAGNDQLKTNAVQTMKAKGVTSFKTV
jgi:adenine-specific DNA-methyltransferase